MQDAGDSAPMPFSSPEFPPAPAEALSMCQEHSVCCKSIWVLERKMKALSFCQEHPKVAETRKLSNNITQNYDIDKVTNWKGPLE